MEALNFIREYVAGFRMPPSLAKLWYGQDEGDAVDNSRSGSILLQVRNDSATFPMISLFNFNLILRHSLDILICYYLIS